VKYSAGKLLHQMEWIVKFHRERERERERERWLEPPKSKPKL